MPGGVRTEIHVPSTATDGAFCLMVDEPPAGWSLPSHRHLGESETIHIVAGRFEMTLGTETTVAEPGATVHVPAGIWHSGRSLAATPGKRVVIFSPGGMDRFFLEVGQPSPNDEFDLPALLSAAGRFGWEFDLGGSSADAG